MLGRRKLLAAAGLAIPAAAVGLPKKVLSQEPCEFGRDNVSQYLALIRVDEERIRNNKLFRHWTPPEIEANLTNIHDVIMAVDEVLCNGGPGQLLGAWDLLSSPGPNVADVFDFVSNLEMEIFRLYWRYGGSYWTRRQIKEMELSAAEMKANLRYAVNQLTRSIFAEVYGDPDFAI